MKAPALLALVVCAFALLEAAPIIREEGAVYLEETLGRKVQLRTVEATNIYYEADLQRYLGTLPQGQTVELQALLGDAYRVRGQARQGGVVGWVNRVTLTPLPPDFIEKIKATAVRNEVIGKLIARQEIAVNMTDAEVLKSLGKPDKKSSRIDEKSRQDVWEYVTYERVPQAVQGYDSYGNSVVNYIYVKKPVGRRAVIFSNGIVTAIEQTEGNLARDARESIVTAPIEIN